MPIVLDLPGSSGNKAQTPDSVDLSITGDIDVRAKMAVDSLTHGAARVFVAKFGAVPQPSWSFQVDGSGGLTWVWTPTGLGGSSISKTATAQWFNGGVAPREPYWVRVTHDVDNGAAGNTVTFYTSPDGVTWTQLGEPVVTAGTTSIHDGTSQVTVGLRDNGGFPFEGQIYKVEIYDGIGGTLVADPDFTDAGQGWTVGDDAGDTGTDDQGNTWTLAGAATIIDQPTNIQGAMVLLHAALGTNAFSPDITWEDITDDMRAVSFQRGRQYELDRINAGTMTVTLSNTSGNYNAHNTAGAYYPNIKPMVPIRLRAVYDGQVYPLWQGFVERWPVSFPARVDSVVDVQCVDLFKALSLADAVQDDRTTTVEALNPVAWWRFEDTEDSAGGNNDLTFAGSPTPGGAAGAWEGDVATTFDGSDDEATVASDADVERQGLDRSYEFWIRPTGNDNDFLLHIGSSTVVTSIVVGWLGATETWRVTTNAANPIDVSSEDDVYQHLVVTDDHNGTNYNRSVYLNGVLAGSATVPDSTGTFTVYIGSQNGIGSRFAGDISEIAVYPTALTQSQVSGLFAASFEAYEDQRTDQRIAYVLSDSAIGLGAEYVFTDLEEGQTTMSGVDSPTDVSALEAIQAASDTERGSFFMTADGYARFHDRHYRLLNQSTPVTTFDATEYVEPVISQDDEQIYNQVVVTTPDGDFVAEDADSIEAYGRRTYLTEIYPLDSNEGYDFAHYIKQQYAEPATRIEAISFRLGADVNLWDPVLNGELGNRYNIEVPLAGDDLDEDMYLESISHTITAGKVWDVTWQLSPASSATFWILGVAGSSELDETTILAY